MATDISASLRENKTLNFKQKLTMVWILSIPTVLAQISSIAMQYIDAAMVGSLGANASASIGLVSSTTWLFGGICMASSYGFSVQIAHAVGAGDSKTSKRIFRHGLIVVTCFSLFMMLIGIAISGKLPTWLGADDSIKTAATQYFFIYACFLPIRQLNWYGEAALQASGNTRTPGILNVLMCIMDVLFNMLFIFETGHYALGNINLPGFGFGVAGAALGTGFAEIVSCMLMLYFACFRSTYIKVERDGLYRFDENTQIKAIRISIPIALEQAAICGAMVMTTRIVAPLGAIAVAANSFAITAESICYMPGYGLEAAATTLVGQAFGAGRKELAKSFAWITTVFGIAIMGCTAVIMFLLCPFVFEFLTPDTAVQALGIKVLRIELFAEPLYAASIVATGALRGAGDTFIPSIMNLVSIWGVRLVLAFILVPIYGLSGAWIAMCIELCFRGTIFLIRLARGKWLDKIAL